MDGDVIYGFLSQNVWCFHGSCGVQNCCVRDAHLHLFNCQLFFFFTEQLSTWL